jgi:translation elongation factor EF-Ts
MNTQVRDAVRRTLRDMNVEKNHLFGLRFEVGNTDRDIMDIRKAVNELDGAIERAREILGIPE